MSLTVRQNLEAARASIDAALAALPADLAPPAPAPVPATSAPRQGFVLGDRSEAELQGVHPRLVAVVRRAIQLTAQDFQVYDGLRTLEEQRAHVAAGTSKTLDSKHLPQADGFGHAVDLVPWIGGKARWEWAAIYPIAAAVWQAASEQGVALTWGGCWDRPLLSLGNGAGDLESAVHEYAARHPGPDLLDGPHYQLRA